MQIRERGGKSRACTCRGGNRRRARAQQKKPRMEARRIRRAQWSRARFVGKKGPESTVGRVGRDVPSGAKFYMRNPHRFPEVSYLTCCIFLFFSSLFFYEFRGILLPAGNADVEAKIRPGPPKSDVPARSRAGFTGF